MNIYFQILLYAIATYTDANQLEKQIKQMIRQEVKSELRNIGADNNDQHYRNGSLPMYTNWSAWSRCQNCVLTRTRKCVDFRCKESRIFEERPCDKKRCDRKRRAKRQDKMHIVQNGENKYATRTLKTKVWSKWSKWADCSPQCKTYRYRWCKSPEKCKTKNQKQHAFCYHERTRCEEYVLNLYDSRKQQDYGVYHYDNQQETRQSPKFPHSARCGQPHKKSRMLKIIGGKEASKYKWPWHVAVLNRYMTVFCAGTLIHPRWVLTAGHCIRHYLLVRLNEHDLRTTDGREIEMVVQKMFLHPRFNPKTVDNDIALLRLPRATNLPVACMPNLRPKSNSKCTIMGWGKTKFSDLDGSPILMEAKVQITHQHTCLNSYQGYVLTSNMFCAGFPNGASDTCAGDSGGGLMCPGKKGKSHSYAVEGITSFGEGCGRANKYGIYTMVFNYQKWIKYTIENYS